MNVRSILKTGKKHQDGFTPIEVLIAVFIISISLLDLAGLQVVAVSNSNISSLCSIGSINSENMAEMMRANIAGVNANVYDQGADAGSINYDTINPASPPATPALD